MGGVVPLGYRAEARALHIVEEHAAVIRTIFARYLERASASALKRSLDDAGINMPERIDGAGRHTGGKPFSRGHLYAILANPIYVGRLVHRKLVHEGQHPAIIDQATFDAVQAKLAANHHAQRQKRLASDHLLLGRIYDDRGTVLSPTHAQKGALRYRYYVSRSAIAGQPTGPVTRVPAPEIEALVIGALRSIKPAADEHSDAALIASRLRRVLVHPDELVLELTDDAAQPIHLPWSPRTNTRRREVIIPPGIDRQLRPMKAEDRARILKAIATARCWIDDLAASRITGTLAIASREGLSERSVRMTLSLAYLSPNIVRAIIDGRLPRGLGIKQLADLPASWAEQEHALGF
jgi:site-specific DNA recombinase